MNIFSVLKRLLQKILGIVIIIYALYFSYMYLLVHDWRYVTLKDEEVKQYAINEDTALKLYQLMKDTHEILTKHNINYWIEGGTLLGAVRHKGIIPFDDDLDISIMHDDEIRFQATINDFEELGYKVRNTYIYTICNNKRPCLDIFIVHKVDNKFIYSNMFVRNKFPNAIFYDNELFPLKKYQFGTIEVYGPAKAEEYLHRSYKEWDKYAIIEQPHLGHIFLSNIEKKTKFILTPELLKPASPTGPLVDRVTKLE